MAVYFAQVCDGAPLKIGTSSQPEKRVRRLRCPLTGEVPRIIKVIDGSYFTEHKWQAFFARHAIRRPSFLGRERVPVLTMTEWFFPTEWMVQKILSLPPSGYDAELKAFQDPRMARWAPRAA